LTKAFERLELLMGKLIRAVLRGRGDGNITLLPDHIRQYRVGKHHSGKHPYGHRLGFKTLIKPAKANIQEHLAEIGRIIQRAKALPQGEVIRQLNPKIRGWAHYYRTCVSQAVYSRLDQLTWEKLRRWAHRRHPTKSAGWVRKRYWHRVEFIPIKPLVARV
jgi:RNA-directed DNA polymerase